MSEKQLSKVAWLALFGALTLIAPFLYAMSDPSFWFVILPSHISEAAMLIVVGCLVAGFRLPKGMNKARMEAISALMVVLWFFLQVWVWANSTVDWTSISVYTAVFWGLTIAEVYLAHAFFTGKEIVKWKLNWGVDVSLAILLLASITKIGINIFNFTLPVVITSPSTVDLLWGIAVFLMTLGYILPQSGYDKKLVLLEPAGLLLAAYIVFAMTTASTSPLLAFV
jgi:hypothetical protein